MVWSCVYTRLAAVPEHGRLRRDGHRGRVWPCLAIFQVARRAAAYALMRPSREILFTVLKREDKYKVKSVTDTLGYRTGDQLGAWSYHGLQGLGLELEYDQSGLQFRFSRHGVRLASGWLANNALWLIAQQRDESVPAADAAPRTGVIH